MTDTTLDWAPAPLRPLIESAVATALTDQSVVGLLAGGSAATGAMDEFSDLDLVVVCRDADHSAVLRDAIGFAGSLGPLLSNFTGEHVREPRLLLCLYGPPPLRVDLLFVAISELDRRIEDERILWQRDGALDPIFRRAPAVQPPIDLQWIEDRFWTWIYNGATKIGRGELFACLETLAFLRQTVLAPLIAQRRGHRPNGVRRLELIAPDLVPALTATIGNYTPSGCLGGLQAAIDLYRSLRVDHPDLVRRTAVESATLAYLADLSARIAARSRE